MIKVVGISGSPRKDGNTEILIKEALNAAKELGAETEFVSLAKKEIKPCNACYSCQSEKTKGECVIKDDMQEIYQILKFADGIIIGSPVYLYSITAQLKAMFDRGLILRYAKGSPADSPGVSGGPQFLLQDKVGGAIAVGGGRNGGQELTIQAIHAWMLSQNMIVVGNNFGLGGTAQAGMPGEVKKDEIGLSMAYHTGKRVTEVAKKLKYTLASALLQKNHAELDTIMEKP